MTQALRRPPAPPQVEAGRSTAELQLESRIAVLTCWGSFGALGIGCVLSGFSAPSVAVGVTGYALLAAAFVAHLIVNRVYGAGFAPGQVAAGLAAFALALVGFVASWVFTPGYDPARVALGLAGAAAGVGGAFCYVAARFGLRGSFSMFHTRTPGDAARSAARRT